MADNDRNTPQPTMPPPPPPPPWWIQPPKKSWLARITKVVFIWLFILSVVTNGYLMMVLSMSVSGEFARSVVRSGDEEKVVALYKVRGPIGPKTVGQFRMFCRVVKNSPKIKAVVLRVDSPGGGVSASDEICRLVKGLKEIEDRDMKVVVSMGSMAASGGYYISVPADEIFAEPTTITGSIGVIASWPIVKGTLDKIGVEPIVMKSTHASGWKDDISPLRKPDARQKKHLLAILDEMQDRFETVVAEGRGDRLKTREASYDMEITEDGRKRTITHKETEPFNGKVYMAEEARELGMIDRIGYRPEAIDRAIELAGLKDPVVLHFKVRPPMMAVLFGWSVSEQKDLDIKGLIDDLRTVRIEAVWRP